MSQLPLFRDLPASQLAEITEGLQITTLGSGRRLMTEKQRGDSIYIILEGTVKICTGREQDEQVVLNLCGPGETLGEINAIDAQGHSATVVTLEPCVLWRMERGFLLHCIQSMPQLSQNLSHVLTRRLRLSTVRIHVLATGDTQCRVARLLIGLADQFVDSSRHDEMTTPHEMTIPLRLVQSDLASMAGATRQHVSQVMTRFKQKRLISVDERYRITIHSREALCQHCF
jgi:CRP-like cAMP-binding protein